MKFKLGLFDDNRFADNTKADEIINSNEHRKVAYQAALESIVLLKNNDDILPLDNNLDKIAVIGPNANDVTAQYGDWAMAGRDENGVPTAESCGYDKSLANTVLEGIKDRVSNKTEVLYEKGCHIYDEDEKDIESAVKVAEEAEAVVAVVGDTTSLYGECLDRADLNLTGVQNDLLKAVKDTGKPLIVVLINGKPLTIPWVKEHADAIIEAWNPGMEGGKALASILFGDYNPSAKLTISFPEHVGQLPVYYNQLAGWHTDRYQDMTAKPLFPFGYGLSYTTYNYSNLRITGNELKTDDILKVYVDVENTGDREGIEIVQAYINDKYSSVTTPVKELKGFTRLQLKPGEKKTAEIDISINSLSIVTRDLKEIVEPGTFELLVGSSSEDKDLLKRKFTVVDADGNS